MLNNLNQLEHLRRVVECGGVRAAAAALGVAPSAVSQSVARLAARLGEPLLQRHLPFWLANLIDRMWVVLVSIIAVLIPLSRVVPPLYTFRVRSRIFRWYGLLRELEQQHAEATRPHAELLDELDQLDARVGRLPVPLSYAEELYALRDRKSTRLNSSHSQQSRMPSSA